MLRRTTIAFIYLMVLAISPLFAQKQVVLVRRDEVLHRLSPGDDFIYRLKGSRRIHSSYVNNIFDYAILAHRDTVPFDQIDRIYFRRETHLNVLGGLMVFGGAALLAIDQVNNTIVQGNEFSIDNGFTTVTLGVIGAGLPLFLIKKKSQKINYRNKLLSVSKGSIFYRGRRQSSGLGY